MTGAAVLVALGVVATGIAILLNDDSADTGSQLRDGTRLFAADPAAKTDGLDQELNAVATAGNTTVAAGGEADQTGYRARFVVSADGGRRFQFATVRTADGKEPSVGEIPRHIAGGAGGWLALGQGNGPGKTVVWASGDGRSWIRRPDEAGSIFGAQDRVNRLVRDDSGFIAVGGTSGKGDFSDVQPAIWRSADGTAWQRLAGGQLGMNPQGGTIDLINMVTSRGALLAQGVRTKKGGRPLNTVWRSGDDGRSWTEVTVPAPPGTLGLTIAATPDGGFAGAREIARNGRAQATVFTSPDGTRWTKGGDITPPGYQRVWRLSSSAAGLTAMVNVNDNLALFQSQSGASWQAAGEVAVPASRTLTDAATADGSTVIVGRDLSDDTDQVLAAVDRQGQDLRPQVPSEPSDRAVQTLTSSRGRVVAAGSANGDAAVWTSTDGEAWSRADVRALVRPGRQRLQAVTASGNGWLAVGVDAGSPWRPFLATSADGTVWQPADTDKNFTPRPGTALVPLDVTAGPAGYVIVGDDGLAPATWFSADLRTWTRGTGTTKDDLSGADGANRWMRGVTAGSFGYVAVGGIRDPKIENTPNARPGVWTSADGRKWAAQQLPAPAGTLEGWFSSIVTKGNLLVAAGTAKLPDGGKQFAFVSADGGRTWQEATLPGSDKAVPDSAMKVAVTPKGFAMVGASGTTANGDAVMWTSVDGKVWTLVKEPPEGMAGKGDQTLTGLTAVGQQLIAVGSHTEAQVVHPVIWRGPVP